MLLVSCNYSPLRERERERERERVSEASSSLKIRGAGLVVVSFYKKITPGRSEEVTEGG
jgi:hypothetical protein